MFLILTGGFISWSVTVYRQPVVQNVPICGLIREMSIHHHIIIVS